MRVAFVGCEGTLTTSKNRRIDAYEHDVQFNALRPFFAARGDELTEVDWRTVDLQKSAFDLIFIRTVYDYTQHVDEFQKFLENANAIAAVANQPDIIRWNMNKHYLMELERKGLPVIDSLFIERPTRLGDIYAQLKTDEVVLKPVVGAWGLGQARYHRDSSDHETVIANDLFAQPFMPAIVESGEISMIFIGGIFSHALVKLCSQNEYRVHKEYGGMERAYTPTASEIATATRFIGALPAEPLACRIDLIRDGGGLLLMEVEAIEPFLFPHYEPAFGERIHAAYQKFLENGSNLRAILKSAGAS
jgi:glutathione synthase/RimK-type ligase-like ATP-grasp enzyme